MPPKLILYSTSVPLTLKLRHDIEDIKFMLDSRKLQFEEIDLAVEADRKEEMFAISGKKTLPQLIVNGKFVGDASELQVMQDFGELDDILNGTSNPPS